MINKRSELPPSGSRSAPKKSKSKILSLVDSPRYAPPMRNYISHTKGVLRKRIRPKMPKIISTKEQ